MINLVDKKDCCGCSACIQRCPKQCIKTHVDNEGFIYPIVDIELCVKCGLCKKVCPVINQDNPCKPFKVYAAYHQNEKVRFRSSSGGIFTLLAEDTILKGGVVFGVKFNEEWMPVFDYTNNIEEIDLFRGSKYVQASIGNTYKQAEDFLKGGRNVLFCGTPCQIAGLRKYLHKDYNNLLTVDIFCHGVPSPLVWRKYLDGLIDKLNKKLFTDKNIYLSNIDKISIINDISFRDKTNGWKNYNLSIKTSILEKDINIHSLFIKNICENHKKNAYMRAYLNDMILRPSCFFCPAKEGKSHSDLTLGDFWGIDKKDPAFDDDKGCGLIFINTKKGYTVFGSLNTISKEKEYHDGIMYNSAYYKSSKPHPNRKKFFEGLNKTDNISEYISLMEKLSLKDKLFKEIERIKEAILRRIKK